MFCHVSFPMLLNQYRLLRTIDSFISELKTFLLFLRANLIHLKKSKHCRTFFLPNMSISRDAMFSGWSPDPFSLNSGQIILQLLEQVCATQCHPVLHPRQPTLHPATLHRRVTQRRGVRRAWLVSLLTLHVGALPVACSRSATSTFLSSTIR